MKRVPEALFFLGLAAFLLLPVFWVVSTSLKPSADIYRLPVEWVPRPASLEHYRTVLADPRVGRYLSNSLVVALLSSLLATFLGALAAFGVGRHRFAGRSFLLGALLLVHLCPNLVSMAALYRMASSLNLLNSLLGLVLIQAAGLSLAVWLLTGYFESLPGSYEEMARTDGCGTLGVFFRVVLPLRIRGVLVAALFLFAQSWKSFFLPLLLVTREDKMTLPLGIYQFAGEHGFALGKVCALSIISLLPPLILLVVLHRLGWESLRARG